MLYFLKNIQFELKNNWSVFLITGFVFFIQIPLQKILYVDLNETFFFNKVLCLNYIFHTKRLILVYIVLVIFFLLLTLYKKKVEVPIYIKIIVGLCILILTWTFSLFEYNYYFNQWHLFDRVLLILLGILSIRYPFITIFFVIQTICISKQFTFPKVLIYTYVDKKIIFDILILYWLFYVFQLFVKNINWKFFIVIILAIIGNWFLLAGLGKLVKGWLVVNQTFNLYSSVQVFGWLQFLPEYIRFNIGSIIKNYNSLVQISAITLEFLFPIIILLHRRLTLPILSLYIVFHLMVFLLSGIFFWKWILLDISMIFIIKYYQLNLSKSKYLLLYFPLLFCNSYFLNSVSLSWFDSGYVYHYKFHVQTEANKIKPLDASFFSPYDIIFAQNRFHYLFDNKVLSYTFGSSNNKSVARYVNDFEKQDFDENKIINLKNKHGISYYDVNKKLMLELFLKKFVLNKLQNDVKWINYIDPPMHIWQGVNQQNFSISNANKLLITCDEVITTNQNHFTVLSSDTLSIDLK